MNTIAVFIGEPHKARSEMNYLPTRGLPILRLPGETMDEARKAHKKKYNRAYIIRQREAREEALRSEADTILGCKHFPGPIT